ncbi:MAG: YggS family pyridoxal phosphate-dependent enzyme [Deltaproteobacteria bacterium]|nr:YggS family pyridoxal phosphate-dependent enzyme [Deltaproteobacteria bacterium]
MISHNIKQIRKIIAETANRCGRSPEEIKLVAVSKRFPSNTIEEAFAAGQKLFGENYIQEVKQKRTEVPVGVNFHFIGHLQTNKARIAAESCDMIETVDRLKLALALNNHLKKLNRTMDILVQVNIGEDANKSGVSVDETEKLLLELKSISHIRVCGLMTIPPMESSPEKSRPHFKNLRLLADKLSGKDLFTYNDKIELSMGMSGDFQIAIEEGATIVRVGTAIFGNRPANRQKKGD